MARKRFNFWLDDKRSEDWSINNLIASLKEQNHFTRAIREGLRLWVDLKAGNVDVLLELFPAIASKLSQHQSANPSGGAGQLEEIKSLLEIIAAEKRDGDKYVMQSALPAGAVKPLPAAPVAVVVAAKAVSADEICDNFLSMFQ